MFSSYIVEKTACPYCGKAINMATNTENERGPEEGDLSVCGWCGGLLIFNEDLSIRKLTIEEIANLGDNERIMLVRIRTEVLQQIQKRIGYEK